MTQLLITVPAGAKCGQTIKFKAPDGTTLSTKIPEGCLPGAKFKVKFNPKKQNGNESQQKTVVLSVAVPAGATAG